MLEMIQDDIMKPVDQWLCRTDWVDASARMTPM
ncbi:hypothetical protein N825_23295 [Skermanella stibiiresistens SB22]|uniref:Uncharacterized protein n=1 Tax=Skermanella stibiiresistens SB22 TaxID=1385369 RepID=W9GSV0_9PROT|nr:hypothetical protein N825_23295 [Skermanella stibiiresistens SB22]